MSQRTNGESGEWRLGPEAETQAKTTELRHEPESAPPPDLSARRLDRPLYVLTSEHLGWFLVVVWAIASRLVDLGARPMSEVEARRALAALGAHPVINGGWFTWLQSALFAGAGAGDYFARLPAALFGLILIASAFAMRRELGRAGALGFAILLTLSPTFTYYSRWDSTLIPALALTTVAIALLYWTMRKPGSRKVVLLGLVVALALSADPIAIPTAAALVTILAVIGTWQAFTTDEAGVRLKVWWERWRGLAILGVVVTAALFFTFETDFFRQPFARAIVAQARGSWNSAVTPGFLPGIGYYLPEIAFYEFFIAALAVVGVLALAGYRLRSRLSVVALLWTAASAAFYLWTPARHPQWILAIGLPAALMGALAIEWLHHTRAWRFVRYPIVALALLTLYAQVLNNFVRIAPDTSEAPWARHALLYWRNPTTTLSTPEECLHALKAVPDRSSAFFEIEDPVLGWYLRSLKVADKEQDASLIVSAPKAASPSNAGETWDFTFKESWQPALAGLNASQAVRYFLTARTWEPLKSQDVRLTVRKSAARHPATTIFVPHTRPSAAPQTTPSPVPSPEASPPVALSPTASPSPVPSPSAASSPMPSATPTTAPAQPSPSATSSPAATASLGATSSSAATPSPAVTSAPNTTPIPAVASTPAATPSSNATPTPAATSSPVATPSPAATSSPSPPSSGPAPKASAPATGSEVRLFPAGLSQAERGFA